MYYLEDIFDEELGAAPKKKAPAKSNNQAAVKAAKAKADKERAAKAKADKEKAARAKAEKAKQAKARADAQKKEAARKAAEARAAKAKAENQKRDAAKKAAQAKAAHQAAAKAKAAKDKAEKNRIAKQKAEQARQAKIKAEADKRAAQAKAAQAKSAQKAAVKSHATAKKQVKQAIVAVKAAIQQKPAPLPFAVEAVQAAAAEQSQSEPVVDTEPMEPDSQEPAESESAEAADQSDSESNPDESSEYQPETEPVDESSESQDEAELGFIGAAVDAAKGLGAVGKGIGKIFKKKKKKKLANKIIQMDPTTITGSVPNTMTSEIKKAVTKVKKSGGKLTADAVARAVAASIPGPVKEVVLEALKAQSLQGMAKEQALTNLSEQVDSTLQPKINAMLTALKANDLQKNATYEHNQLVEQARFKDNTLNMLQAAYEKLAAIEARLNMSAVIAPGKYQVYGSKNVLESR